MIEETKNNQQIESIESFIKTKDKLLTTFGVFLALTIFTKDIEGNPFGKYLSFIFMTLTLLIWLELWSSFPSKNRSWTLVVFENLITIGTIFLFLYWITGFYEKGKLFIFIGITALVATILAKLAEKFNWFRKLKNHKFWNYKMIRYTIGFLFILAYMLISFIIAALIMGGINPLIEYLKEL